MTAVTTDEKMTRSTWRVAWTGIFLPNLIVPLLLGWSMCGSMGQLGLALAVLACWGLGLAACDGRSRRGRALVYGGFSMALAQLYPMAQLYAGMIAIGAWYSLSGDQRQPLSGPGGFVVTVLTGGILMTASLICGFVIDAMFYRPPTHKPKDMTWDELWGDGPSPAAIP